MILVLAGSSPVGQPNSRFMEGAAEWSATGLENQGMVRCRGSIPPPSSYHSQIFLTEILAMPDIKNNEKFRYYNVSTDRSCRIEIARSC